MVGFGGFVGFGGYSGYTGVGYGGFGGYIGGGAGDPKQASPGAQTCNMAAGPPVSPTPTPLV